MRRAEPSASPVSLPSPGSRVPLKEAAAPVASPVAMEPLEGAMRAGGLTLAETVGVAFNPILDRWSLGSDLDVNYLAVATKA